VAGVMAVTTYFAEHRDRYPVWIGGEVRSKRDWSDYLEPRSFEDSLIRSLAAALARINACAGFSLLRHPDPPGLRSAGLLYGISI